MVRHNHKPGSLKQSNKKNKRSKASKRDVKRSNGGRVSTSSALPRGTGWSTKQMRRNVAKQKRESQRQQDQQLKHQVSSVPRVVGIVCIGGDVNSESFISNLILAEAGAGSQSTSVRHCIFRDNKKNSTLSLLPCREFATRHDDPIVDVLELARVCDILVFVLDCNAECLTNPNIKADELVSPVGRNMLKALKSQGLPSPVLLLSHSRNVPGSSSSMQSGTQRLQARRLAGIKQYAKNFAMNEFGKKRGQYVCLDLSDGVQSSCKTLIQTLCTMASSQAQWIGLSTRAFIMSDKTEYIERTRQLCITGFVRGECGFDINGLVHVPNVGTFKCESITAATWPLTNTNYPLSSFAKTECRELESLNPFAVADTLNGDQNLIGFDDMDAEMDDLTDGATCDNNVQSSAMEFHHQRTKEVREDVNFPDEVQVEEGIEARNRFARYRAVKSLQKSIWNTRENLPDSYSRIYHFRDFLTSQNEVLEDAKQSSMSPNSVPHGMYVTITVADVSSEQAANCLAGKLHTAVSLLRHQNKISVVNMSLMSTVDGSTLPIRNKDKLIFRCGWRTWEGRPIFSEQNLNSAKHKALKFMPSEGSFFVASVFGPVSYTPCPVLVMSGNEIVATGSVSNVSVDRLVLKRVVLTGYPLRVHNRSCTVKHMFHNPEDVAWFRPAGLYTKHGLKGHIVDSVGDHGTMKCLFNAPVKQHDTVCIALYKRIFPKFPSDSYDSLKIL